MDLDDCGGDSDENVCDGDEVDLDLSGGGVRFGVDLGLSDDDFRVGIDLDLCYGSVGIGVELANPGIDKTLSDGLGLDDGDLVDGDVGIGNRLAGDDIAGQSTPNGLVDDVVVLGLVQ